MTELIRQFANDPAVQAAAVLVALDFVLGVSAALKSRTFRLSFLADVLRADVLGKLIPYYAVWVAAEVGGDFEIPGLDLGAVKAVAAIAVWAALSGSILNSLRDLGLWKSAPDALAGSDPSSPN
jgi:hypothetical protein